MKWPTDGIDINSIKLDMDLTWVANLEGRAFASFYSSGLLGHNKPRGVLESIPYYKFALVHCARRVHTPEMEEKARFIKREAMYRYDKI